MGKVLVLDASERSALAFVRSLGKEGIEVAVGDSERYTTALLSKYCKKRLRYTSPEESQDSFLKNLKKILSEDIYDMLIPVSEFTITIVSYHKKELEVYTKVAAPDYEKYKQTYDKAQTAKLAKRYGVPHPKTEIIDDSDKIEEVSSKVKYPVVIKPRMKTYWYKDKCVVVKVTQKNYAKNKKDLIERYGQILKEHKELEKLHLLPLVQEYIPGQTYGVEFLLNNGRSRATFIHRRLCEYPTTGGASTLRESVWNPQLIREGVRILQKLRWHGLAMAEFRWDTRDDTPKLIEINGRPWGSLPLAVTAGVDFPFLYYRMLIEGDVKTQKEYKVGVKQKWLIPGHLLWFYAKMMDGPNRIQNFAAFIRSLSYPDDIISLDDSLPTLGAIKVASQTMLEVLKGKRKITGEMY